MPSRSCVGSAARAMPGTRFGRTVAISPDGRGIGCTNRFGVVPIAPDSMIGSMATVRLPDRLQDPAVDAIAIQAALYDTHHIEVPLIELDGTRYVRVSAAPYNRPEEYEALIDAVASVR